MSQPTPAPDDDLGSLLSEPEAQAWFEQHLTELRQDAYGQRILYWVLATAFVVGLLVYVVGYLPRSSAPIEPFGLLADMLYTLGFALWTAVVVVVLIEVIPEVKRRQIRRSLEAYERIRRKKAGAGIGVIEQP